ncbi:TauD/TfdA dioxygenase family protein [Candidatus Poriferisocius sp.]|uniref:TauD/TfdA dioxygenase family protein n=1 Tax=Candidatus Poriferisocius sp. TaxID=3101276 RepID=UPI003B594754
MEIRQLAGALGAEVLGLDLTSEIFDTEFASVRDALHGNGVICIRGQEAMTPEDQLAFAAKWGEVSIHPYVPSIEGYPGIMKIYDPNPITQTWHSDSTHMREPHAYTLLLARVLPEVGGDTMFASATRAFESLSPGLQELLRSLSAVHEGTSLAADAGLDHEAVVAVHPMVRVHPDTGAEALFVNGNYVTRIDRWTLEESRPLLEHLYGVIGRYENTYRHRWCSGDLVIWDNRLTQHAVVGDVAGEERVLHRVTIAGSALV